VNRAVAADPAAAFPPHPDRPYVDITGDEAARLFASGVPFLDARRTSVFEEGHVAGARPFSVWESDIDQKVMALITERDGTQPLVVYCSGGDCEDSHLLAQKLWGAGFNDNLVYRDGYPDWVRRGGAVRTGAKP
jgi:rhodanese-related sulfurtransferase